MTAIDADAVADALDALEGERAFFSAKVVARQLVDDPDAGDINAAAYHLSDLRADRDDVTVWSEGGRNNTYQFVDDAPEVRADGGTIHTTLEIDADLWRELRAEGIREGREIREQLEVVLRERYREVRADGGEIQPPEVSVGDRVTVILLHDGEVEYIDGIVTTVHSPKTIDAVYRVESRVEHGGDGAFERDHHTDRYEFHTSLVYMDDIAGWLKGWDDA